MISDERFFAWLDGELEPAEAASVEAIVADDPNLQRRADEHRALGQRLRAAFDPVADMPVPDRLRPQQAEVVDLASRRPLARPIARGVQWAAMAATLAIGVVAGTIINPGASGPVGREEGRMVAAGALEEALYTRLASAPADDGARIGLTFRNADGDLCRSFTDETLSGLACHEGGDWRIRGLFQAGEGQQSDYRMAAGQDPRLAELVGSTMAGEPFDAAAEKQALDALR